jgi:hypothetical protein
LPIEVCCRLSVSKLPVSEAPDVGSAVTVSAAKPCIAWPIPIWVMFRVIIVGLLSRAKQFEKNYKKVS